MLVDSQPGWIELLPALPAGWYEGRIEGIRCRGNIEIRSLDWSQQTVRATLRSAADQTIQLRMPGETTPRAVTLPAGRMSPSPQRPSGMMALRNPVWTSKDNLRDPSVLPTKDGYRLFYSRYTGEDASSPNSWSVAEATTRDFSVFENDRDVSPKGHASPGDVIEWHGRHILPYQTYPARPTRLCFSESQDLRNWSPPKIMLEEAAALPWNDFRRVIDPTLVVDGDTLHCYFVGSGKTKDAEGREIRANLLGHAITRDPKLEKWEILTRDKPLIGISPQAPDGVENIMIFRTGDHWTMIYSEGLAETTPRPCHVQGLISWKLEGPIDIPVQSWMARKHGAPFVWREKDRFWMILMGENAAGRTTFGLLHSTDGKTWQLLPGVSPLIVFRAGVVRARQSRVGRAAAGQPFWVWCSVSSALCGRRGARRQPARRARCHHHAGRCRHPPAGGWPTVETGIHFPAEHVRAMDSIFRRRITSGCRQRSIHEPEAPTNSSRDTPQTDNRLGRVGRRACRRAASRPRPIPRQSDPAGIPRGSLARKRRRETLPLCHHRSVGRRNPRLLGIRGFQDLDLPRLNWPTKKACTSPTSRDAMVWAPSVVRGADGKFHMYVSVGNEDLGGVAEHPLGPWRDANGGKPLVPENFRPGFHMIDAEAFIDDRRPGLSLLGIRLELGERQMLGGEAQAGHGHLRRRGAGRHARPVFRAPFMVKRGNRYHLMYSGGKTIEDTYQVHHATGDSPFGPFTEAPNSPCLVTDHSKRILSPGHHAVFERDGRHYILYHRHSIPFDPKFIGRQICVDEMRFQRGRIHRKNRADP
jgi:hypothetical protein